MIFNHSFITKILVEEYLLYVGHHAEWLWKRQRWSLTIWSLHSGRRLKGISFLSFQRRKSKFLCNKALRLLWEKWNLGVHKNWGRKKRRLSLYPGLELSKAISKPRLSCSRKYPSPGAHISEDSVAVSFPVGKHSSYLWGFSGPSERTPRKPRHWRRDRNHQHTELKLDWWFTGASRPPQQEAKAPKVG